MEIQELKARAYDLLANIEYNQAELRQVNQQIAELSSNPPVESKPKVEEENEEPVAE